MKPEVARQLQDVLDFREQKEASAKKQVAEQHKKEIRNLADFVAKKEKVIRPALQEIVDLYKIRGLVLRIFEDTEPRAKDARPVFAPAIRLDMAGVYTTRSEIHPEFKLTFEKRSRTVSLYTATQSAGGHGGDIALDELTADWIHREFVKYESASIR